MSGSTQENIQWLSVTEDTLFLHDGLIRVTDLVELPHDVNSSHDGENEVVTFDSKSPAELAAKLISVCGTHNNAYSRLLEYRLNAVRGFWNANQRLALEEQSEREASATQEETIAVLKKQGLWKESEQAAFSTRVGLLLVLPLLQSQSKFDSSLCGITAEVLLNCLRDCPPLSLSKEPNDCLNGLENLLCSWLEEGTSSETDPTRNRPSAIHKENTALALVALACARGHLETFIHTVHLLQHKKTLGQLPIADILAKLVDMDGGQGQTCALLGSKHINSWGLDDMLSAASDKNGTADKDKLNDEVGRSCGTDGKFIYTTNNNGRGIAKIGTGLHGTLRGYVYTKNTEIGPGRLTIGNGLIFYRPVCADKEQESRLFIQLLDPYTLTPTKDLCSPPEYVIDTPFTTISLCSDGMFFYWVWMPGVITDRLIKNPPVFLEVFKIQPEELVVTPLRPRVLLQKKEDGSAKAINESLLSRLRPYRASPTTATLVALPGEPVPSRKEEGNGKNANTSCGIPLKSLSRTPMFSDGTSIVLLSSIPGASTAASTRSLFGSGSSLSGLRTLASNNCFSVHTGQFVNRVDLLDAPSCSLARGAPVSSVGICYDVTNNMIWNISGDYVDQFYNPSHQARHHVLHKLGIDPLVRPTPPLGNHLPVSEIIQQLLQHVGSMCLQQLNNDLFHSPKGSYILQQQPVNVIFMDHVCDILDRAIKDENGRIVKCALLVLQLIFKVNVFKRERPEEAHLLKRTNDLLWGMLEKAANSDNASDVAIKDDVCRVISSGLYWLYPSADDQNSLLHKLLMEGHKSQGLEHLRNLLFIDLAEQLKNNSADLRNRKILRVSDKLVHFILKITVRESCMLLRECLTAETAELEKLLASVPLASPCLRYLMALQSHLLRDAVLFHDKSTMSEIENKEKFHDLQAQILAFSSRVFSAAFEVSEVLLETCNGIINSSLDDLEFRLQGLERVTKATIMGHLIPVLLTALTHPNLHCLSMADVLMPQLVQLVLSTSQAALLLKSQVLAIRQDDLIQLDQDVDISELIGETLNLDRLEVDAEEGFLAGLKIPAPWATGKTVESIHPVRDNYKYKETVHIPGARCLYLRFDSRSATQYDYDKVVVYAGPNTSARKVAEYGGNTYGFGSRSVLGAGWPKDLVKVEGDTVTFSFEMRSGREHNTPDKALWGFLVTVRAQESVEEVSNGLPFLADLALGLCVLACTMLHLLYHGPEKTKEESVCGHLLKSKLLQRCVWQSEATFIQSQSPGTIPIEEDTELKMPSSPSKLPRIKLPAEKMKKLRSLSGRLPPQIRPSIREVIVPEDLEESIVSATIKHLMLADSVHQLAHIEENQTDEYWLLANIMSDVYGRIDALVRQLQTIAEIEQRWQVELKEIQQEALDVKEAFFMDYHLVENKNKELTMLCFLKDVEMDNGNPEISVTALRERMETELSIERTGQSMPVLPKTRALVFGLKERLNLLLQVNIGPETGQPGLARSISHYPGLMQKTMPDMMARSDTEILHANISYGRSISVPANIKSAAQDDSIVDIMKLQRKRQYHRKGTVRILEGLVDEHSKDRPPHVVLLDQLFLFIGSDPDKAVSCDSFLSAAKIRQKRGCTRKQALVHMKELLAAASRVGGATHLVAAVTSVLQHGPRIDELTCGGVVDSVRDAFAETMTSVVQLAARYPIACCNSIGLLCVVPYTRAEEKCLMRSGLVHLLDRLCSLSNCRSDSTTSDTQTTKQKVAAMAWAGFQVLASRYVEWEQDESVPFDELEHSGLARQVSILLTNHLARATESSGNEAAGNEALQEILNLLNNLSRSKMGKAILSQPACVSKLLSLLLDQRPSPNLVLIILQLCRVALPLMSADDSEKVQLPAWGQDLHTAYTTEVDFSEPMVKIASLLLSKLGDFIVPGGQTTISGRQSSKEQEFLAHSKENAGGEKDATEDSDVRDGRLSVFLYKREEQSSHEVIQPLISSDSRTFRINSAANIERIVRMDRDMTKNNKAEVTTEDAVSSLRKAAKWAQLGLVVSTGPPVDITLADNNASDKKKTGADVVCKEKNVELSRSDPIRPFISGHVANSMASEVIALLHGLLTSPETMTAQMWVKAVEKVISNALSCLPLLMNSLENLGSPRCSQDQLMAMAKQVDAALCALGGFKETIKPGCEVKIVGDGICSSEGTVMTLSEQTGLATIKLSPPPETEPTASFSNLVQVPLSRLQPPRNEPLPLHHLSMMEAIVTTVQSLLLPQNGCGSPIQQPLPVHGDGNCAANQICRVVAEIRTRACMVLSGHLNDVSFASTFIQHSSAAIEILKSLSKDCSPGERFPVTEAQCERLRMLYRDCAKPPPPPTKAPVMPAKEITWDPTRTFPPVRACLFSHGQTGITFLSDPSAGSGLPRGTMVYATQSIPQQAPSFYWEIEICSFGDSQEESGPIISFGFAPGAEKKDGAWTNPIGTCLFHNNGRAVHYNGSSLLQWKSARLDVSLNAGDVAGVGWERQGDTPALPGQQVRGQVYFTYNGERLNATLDEVSGGLWPVVHIQKKNTRVRANFGTRAFAYAEGQHHRNAADECHDATFDFHEVLHELPFQLASDSESDGSSSTTTSLTSVDIRDMKNMRGPTRPPCRVPTMPKSNKEYNSEVSRYYKLLPCYGHFPTTGPDLHTQQANQDTESDIDDAEDSEPSEDHYALLVKAWEQKVFPVIKRRFRNEAERKDGLEQIRGALQLGMTDIARQTVEFLYEENGGMPRDLHLPTIDDIKEELAKFTIERVRKGTTVVIRNTSSVAPTANVVLPKFAVRGMLKTFGLTGNVLDIDSSNELVLVETYLRSEGVLVRYWYPLEMLERPPAGCRKNMLTGQHVMDTSNVYIHRELLKHESTLARMYCRSALLQLIQQCNSPAMETLSCGLSSTIAASAAVLQDLDIENLQLLSNELLAQPQPDGCLTATSLLTSQTPGVSLAANTCSFSDLFYFDKERLQQELQVAIARAAHQGEDYLIELTNQLCLCLQTAPEMFPFEEIPVTETKINTDVQFSGAAFLVISCRMDPKAPKKETSPYKSPWARIFSYTGNRVRKNGDQSKQELVCYPRDTSTASNSTEQYSPVIVPCDQVFIRVGVSPPPGHIITLHAVPAQFPLAVAYLEMLVTQRAQPQPSCAMNEPQPKSDVFAFRDIRDVSIPPPVILHATELLTGYLWRSDIPGLLKEYMFHILAQSIRVLNRGICNVSGLFPTASPTLSPSHTLFSHLQTELKGLYDEETKGWPSGTTVSGHGMGLGFGDYGRFSTYFHSLMEVCLAISEVGGPSSGTSIDSQTSLSPPPAVPSSPHSSTKRKKLKARRERTNSGPRLAGSPRGSESDSSVGAPPVTSISFPDTSKDLHTGLLATSSSGASMTSTKTSPSLQSAKPEDLLWFHRALTLSQILQFLTNGTESALSVTNDAISDAAQTLQSPSIHSRLLVISGIPKKLSKKDVVTALQKVCNCCGGLFKNEFFLPTEQVPAEQKDTSNSETAKPKPENEPAPPPVLEEVIKGYAVLELRSKTKLDTARKAIFKNKSLLAGFDFMLTGMDFDPADMQDEMLSVSSVNQNLFSDPQGNPALEHYLTYKLLTNSNELVDRAMIALTEVFHSCFISEHRVGISESRQESGGFICLTKDQIMMQTPGNLLGTYLSNIRAPKKTLAEQVSYLLKHYGVPKFMDKEEATDKNGKGKNVKKPLKPSKERLAMGATGTKVTGKDRKPKSKESLEKPLRGSASAEAVSKSKSQLPPKEEEKLLTLDGFLQFVLDKGKQDIRAVWRSFLSTGYDIHLDRSACLDNLQAQQMCEQWSPEMDSALVQYVDKVCKHLAISPARLHPHEIYLTDVELSSEACGCLQGIPVESLRLRFALLQSINKTLETFFIPLVDLRPAERYSHSTAALLSKARGLIFYDTKIVLLNRILNSTAKRKPDQPAPEIVLDPLENVGNEVKDSIGSTFCQALRQLNSISSTSLCVRIAAGGDPTYSFNVRLTGEEVHGTSGSFRHFLTQVAKELQGPILNLLMPCPSSALHKNKGKYILKPGPMTYSEEKLLIFFGQLLGITMRADIPLGLDLLPVFWKKLASLEIDPVTDLRQADILTYKYIKRFEMVESESELLTLSQDTYPRFIYTTVTGDEVELIQNGSNTFVGWDNLQQYTDAIRTLRMKELACTERMQAIRAGLASIVPLQTLAVMTPIDLELRICGLPDIDIDFLKAHTMYQVGLMDTDPHIEHFWNALESFSQEDLRKFIKFACNQDRIPMTCPCRDGGIDTAHVPPYPMKIAPPDGPGTPDARYIRVETCMFMIKLPQYSSQEIMSQRLLYAIHCREDPLSG